MGARASSILVALWAYGAATFPDRPLVEWDSWYLLPCDATGEWSPRHVLRENTFDGAWVLHRAHWLAGQYINLVGADPTDVVRHTQCSMDAGSYGAWKPAMLPSRRLPRPSGRWMRSTLVGVPRSGQRCACTMTPRPPRTSRSGAVSAGAQSARRALDGSTPAARIAGIQLATSATPTRAAATDPYVTGSVALTPKSRVSMTLLMAPAAAALEAPQDRIDRPVR